MPDFNFIEKVPMHTYPWGVDMYGTHLLTCQAEIAQGIINACVPFVLWHGVLHLSTAIIIVYVLHRIHRSHPWGAYAAIGAYVIWFLYQELIDQPLRLGQPLTKAIIDLGTWLIPVVVWLIFMHRAKHVSKKIKK